jgi:hypothetical protein
MIYMQEEDKVPQYPLYHGMRSKKSADQIKREGFCAYGSPIDEKKNIVDALRYFGKEKLLTTEGRKGDRIRSTIREIQEPSRRVVWATTSQDAPCAWWAHANPEHTSLPLHQIDIEPEKIDKYLREKFGSNCYNVKLKMIARGQYPNFNTGINCIPPNLIDGIETCKECKFTGKEHKHI